MPCLVQALSIYMGHLYCLCARGKIAFMRIVAIGTDEPDYGKEKLKSLGAITSELITGEAQYLQSLQCIVDVSHAFFFAKI